MLPSTLRLLLTALLLSVLSYLFWYNHFNSVVEYHVVYFYLFLLIFIIGTAFVFYFKSDLKQYSSVVKCVLFFSLLLVIFGLFNFIYYYWGFDLFYCVEYGDIRDLVCRALGHIKKFIEYIKMFF